MKFWPAAGWFFVCWLWVGAASATGEVLRFALVIGNNQPEKAAVASLRYADDDAVATHRLLEQAGVQSTLLVTLDADSRALHPELTSAGAPRVRDLERAFATLTARMQAAARRGERAELLIFYSGHGDVDHGEGYVVLEDGRLTRSKLYGFLAGSRAAKNHVFVDACKSYFLAFEKGPGGHRTPYARAFLGSEVPARLENTGFVLSTSSDRESHEWERYQAGILSHELRSALRGAADADLDGRVTYAELGAFLGVANRSIPNERFRPDFFVRPPDRDLKSEVLRWNPETAAIQLEPARFGHVYVETAHGIRVLDAHPTAGEALRLHAPLERPLFLRRNDETAEFVVTRSELALVSGFGTEPVEIASRGALHLAFERLFELPFGTGSVRDFERAARQTTPHGTSPALPEPERDAANSESSGKRVLRYTAGAVALGAAATGVTLSSLSLASYLQSDGASQVELEHENERRQKLNLAALVCYGVAGVAGATWLWAELTKDSGVSVTVGTRARAPTEITLRGRF